jgi:hypothetical protein
MPVPAAALSWYERLVLISTSPGSTNLAVAAAAASAFDEAPPEEDPLDGEDGLVKKLPKPSNGKLLFEALGWVLWDECVVTT